ncbi:MAG: apolipoprotein N-acyltransferase [Candidatus Erginobacter occultus]|nr:apolipoprotein N-acyltransferase [Candidatus Erginobacter occultus]
MKRSVAIFLFLLSGLLFAASLPGLGWEWLIWIAFIPLLAAVERVSPGKSFAGGFAVGVITAGVLLSFIPSSGRGIGMSAAKSWASYLFLAGYYGLYAGLFAYLSARFFQRVRAGRIKPALPLLLVFIPAAWTGLEFVHSRLLPGMPWTFIFPGYFLWRATVLIQVADITGVYGLSFLILLVNTGIFLAASRRKILPAAAAAGAVLACLVYGGYRLSAPFPRPADLGVRVAVLQGNIPAGVKWDDQQGEMIAGRYLDLCRRTDASRPDLVIWTETAIPWPVGEGDDLVEAALTATAASGAAHIIGSPAPAGEGSYFNSALLVLPEGEVTARYDKVRLLTLIEDGGFGGLFTPGSPGGSGYLPGREHRILSSPRGRAGVTICNENFYPEMNRRLVREGAEFLVNLTNDAWWPDRFRLTGHFLFNVLRSVENRRATVVASNVGISALIDDRGRVLKTSPIREPYLLSGEIEKSRELSFYSRRGDVFAVSSLLAAGGGVLWTFSRT